MFTGNDAESRAWLELASIGGSMSNLALLEQLHGEWQTEKLVWEDAQKKVDDTMLKYCLGKCKPPSREMMDGMYGLMFSMCVARVELDQFILKHVV
jgi:hypothetical protein